MAHPRHNKGPGAVVGARELFTPQAPGWPILLQGRRFHGKRPGLFLTTDLLQGLGLQQSEPHKPITTLPITGCRETPKRQPPPSRYPQEEAEDTSLHPYTLMVHDGGELISLGKAGTKQAG